MSIAFYSERILNIISSNIKTTNSVAVDDSKPHTMTPQFIFNNLKCIAEYIENYKTTSLNKKFLDFININNRIGYEETSLATLLRQDYKQNLGHIYDLLNTIKNNSYLNEIKLACLMPNRSSILTSRWLGIKSISKISNNTMLITFKDDTSIEYRKDLAFNAFYIEPTDMHLNKIILNPAGLRPSGC